MSTESDPNQNPNANPPAPATPATPATPAGEPAANQDAAAKDAAAKALGQAKEKMNEGLAVFKKLDQPTQIYLGGLALAFLCAILFGAFSVTVTAKGDNPMAEMMKKNIADAPSYSAFRGDWRGKLAVLAAAAGIGLWVWSFMGKKKDAWIPLALAGAAGFSALMFLLLLLGAKQTSVDTGLVKIDAGLTIFGFWLPFAGAIAATVVSVKRIMKPQPAPPAA